MAQVNQVVPSKRNPSARKRNRTATLLASIAAVPMVGLLTQSASATLVYWDPTNGTGTGTGSTAPSGTWDTTSAQWNPVAAGTGTPAAWNNASVGGDTAVFAAGSDATGVYGVTGSGAITLAGINREEGTPTITFTGALTFAGGALAINAGSATGNLNLNAPFDGSPTGTITKIGTSLAAFGTAQGSFAGTWIVNAGSVAFAGDTRIGIVPLAPVAAQITLTNASNLRASVAGPVTFNVNRGLLLGAGGGGFDGTNPFTWAGAISGAVGNALNIAGTELVTVTNTGNSYLGATVFTSTGQLLLGASEVIPDTSAVTFNLGGTFNLNNFDETVKAVAGVTAGVVTLGDHTLTLANPTGESFAGTFTGSISSKIVKSGTGVQKLAGNNTTTFLGEFDLNGGTLGLNNNGTTGVGKLVINNASTISNSVTANGRQISNATVDLFANLTVDDTLVASPNAVTFVGTTTLKAANLTLFVGNTPVTGLGGSVAATITGAIADDSAGRGFIKAGSGMLLLTNNANTYGGDTTISAGLLGIDPDATLGNGVGTVHLSGGNLVVTGSRTVVTPNPVDVAASSAITTTSAASTPQLTLSGPLSGSSGTLTFRNDGADANTDEFQVRLSGSFSFGLPVVIDGGALGKTRLSSFNTTGTSQTFTGDISGNGTFFRSSSSANSGGETVLAGNNSYSGGTSLIDGGIGIGSDSVGAITSGPLGTGTLTVNPTGSTAYLFAYGGAHSVANPITLTGTLGVQGSNNLTLAGAISGAAGITLNLSAATLSLNSATDSTFASVTGAGTLSKDNTNTVTVNFVRPTSLVVNGGILKTNPSTSGGGTSVVSTIVAPTGKLDLNDNKLVVTGGSVGAFNVGNPGAYDGVSGLVATGRHGGNWDQPGIITSQSAALTTNGALTTLAVAAASDVKDFSASTTALFGGQTVHATDTLVMYTWNGDANLDGKVNADDYFLIDSHYNSATDAAKSFHNGDFNYDGQINGDDYSLIDAAFAGQTGTFPSAPALGGVSAVPEPASLAGIVIAAAASLKRRRRRSA